MVITPIHIEGKDKGKVMLYALSTCGHCKRARELLNQLGVSYDYLYVDQLSREEMDIVLKEVEQYNPRGSFPTIVINGSHIIIGARENEIREALA